MNVLLSKGACGRILDPPLMDAGMLHIAFSVDDQHYAVPLDDVERVLRAVEVTPLPETFGAVGGVINLRGRAIPVVDLRRRFKLPERELGPHDQLLVVSSANTTVALPVDETLGIVREEQSNRLDAAELVSQLSYVSSVLPIDGRMVMVLDVQQVLTASEMDALSAALDEANERAEAIAGEETGDEAAGENDVAPGDGDALPPGETGVLAARNLQSDSGVASDIAFEVGEENGEGEASRYPADAAESDADAAEADVAERDADAAESDADAAEAESDAVEADVAAASGSDEASSGAPADPGGESEAPGVLADDAGGAEGV
jgi:purine-binding chemotaxis protein CheW